MIEYGKTEFEYDLWAYVDFFGYLLHLRVQRSRIYAGTDFVIGFRRRLLTVTWR